MSFWTAIVAIVLIGAIASVIKARYNAMHGITEDNQGNQTFHRRSETDEAAQAEIAALKERIQILERIATDNNSLDARERARISAEIEALRGTEKTNADTKETDQ